VLIYQVDLAAVAVELLLQVVLELQIKALLVEIHQVTMVLEEVVLLPLEVMVILVAKVHLLEMAVMV
jgi:hypothetical protein